MDLSRKIRTFTQMRRERRARAAINRRAARLGAAVAANAPAPVHPPVVLFNASTRLVGISLNAAFQQLAAWSLRLEGAPVAQFVCHAGMTRCVLGTRRDDPSAPPPCGACIAQSRALYTGSDVRWFTPESAGDDAGIRAALGGLDVAQMQAFAYDGIPLGSLCLPALRWVLRRHHLPEDDVTRRIYGDYILSAWRVAQAFAHLLDDVRPQAVVVFNGMFYPEATARWVARQRGIRVVTHEVGFAPLSAYFTDGEATAYPIDIPADFELDDAQNRRLDAYLEQRFQGNFSMAGIRFWSGMQGLSADFLQKAAGFRQVVPVFTNVIFDTSQPHANAVFETMFAWLDLVLEVIRAHPETLFVIRAHPDEARPGKESRESVAQWVTRSGADQLPNVAFVGADETISSYELIARAKFVMIYNSTIGLEAALMGAAVLCGGKARFTPYATVFFPPTPDDYRRQAEAMLSAEKIEAPPEFRRNARRFLYTQLYRTSLPLGDLVEEDGVWKGFARFKPVGWESLRAAAHPSLRVIVDGLLNGEPFLLEQGGEG